MAAIFRNGAFGVAILELSSDFRKITAVHSRKYIKQELLQQTTYTIEVCVTQEPQNETQSLFSYRLIRILSPEDLDPKRWLSTPSLRQLPVSPEPDFTSEELIWAGEREGNLGSGLALVSIVCAFAGYTIWADLSLHSPISNLLFPIAVSTICGAFLIQFDWKRPKSPDPTKLAELSAYKKILREDRIAKFDDMKTEFEKSLERFENWEQLSADAFELAISLRLEKEGFTVKKTRFSKDGGIDIEAIDNSSKPLIVQVKKYTSNVGVAVVREMIGVRESRDDKPRTMIYSLNGFSRDAKELAKKHSIELRDIRSELFNLR